MSDGGGGGGGSKSSGPSPGDTSLSQPLQTLAQGPQGDAPVGQSISENLATPISAPTNLFNVGGSFSADSTASSGVGGPSTAPPPIATIADPTTAAPSLPPAPTFANPPPGTTGVFDIGTTPFQTFGTAGETTGQNLGVGQGPATGVTAPAPPTGVSAPAGPDPTSQNKTPSSGTASTGLGDLLGQGVSKLAGNPLGVLGALGTAYSAYQSQQALKGLPSVGQSTGGMKDIAAQIAQMRAQLLAGIQPTQQHAQGTADALNAQAAPLIKSGQGLIQQGTALTQPLSTGTLPPEYQTLVDQAKADARATIIANYANRGLPTDPTRNSSLAAELANLDRQSVIQATNLAQQLAATGQSEIGIGAGLTGQGGQFTTQAGAALSGADQTAAQILSQGTQAAGLQSSIYANLASIDQTASANMGKAIANFSGALAGKTTTSNPTLTIKTG